MNLFPGNHYKLTHQRFGKAVVRVQSVHSEWVSILIVQGKLVGLNHVWEVGDEKEVRRSHCVFEEVKP